MNKTPVILCIDDDEKVLNSLKRLLRKENYKILTASSGQRGLEILEEEPVDLIIANYRMPGMDGIEFLKRAKMKYPDTIRIILSGYTEVNAITTAINEGNIYKFITKPWDDEELKLIIRRSLEQHQLQKQNRRLSEKIREQFEQLQELNRELELKIEERTKELMIKNQALMLSRDILENLPVAVLGVSEDHLIVFLNKKANQIFKGKVLLGQRIGEIFPEEVEDLVNETLRFKKSLKLEKLGYNGCYLQMESSPLDHRGVILVAY